jgi:thioredoxin 1
MCQSYYYNTCLIIINDRKLLIHKIQRIKKRIKVENMRKLIILQILLATLIIATGCTEKAPDNSTNSQNIQGVNSVVEVTQLEQINTALQKGPVFLKIGAEWCEPCQEMKPILKDLATEYSGKATIMSVDVDKSPKLIDYFGVGSVPDSSVIVGIENDEYIYMQEDGKVSKDRFQARILGLRDEKELKKSMDLALRKENAKST